MAPVVVIIDPGTGFGTVRWSATLTPIGFRIEPSLCTVDPGTTADLIDDEM